MPEQYTTQNRISLVHSGEDYFSLLFKLIEKENQVIHLQTYIYENDETGRKVAEALKDAVKRGVSVYLHVDGYASQNLRGKFRTDLEQAGIHFKFFEPLLKSRILFRKKIASKDICCRRPLFFGWRIKYRRSINDMPNEKAWYDVALYSEGEISYQLHLICNAYVAKTQEVEKIEFIRKKLKNSVIRSRKLKDR